MYDSSMAFIKLVVLSSLYTTGIILVYSGQVYHNCYFHRALLISRKPDLPHRHVKPWSKQVDQPGQNLLSPIIRFYDRYSW
jgi:hypothetical protein